MKFLSFIILSCCFMFITTANSITVTPDSVSLSVNTENYHFEQSLGAVTLKNQSDSTVIVDSLFIQFLNGDSTDFIKGKVLTPTDYYLYYYSGWAYSSTRYTMRHVRDSVFVLQDTTGTITSLTIAPNDSLQFKLYLPVNCPICGRLPSFPATSKYIYRFHSKSGIEDSVHVSINVSTSIKNQRHQQRIYRSFSEQHEKTYDLYGRLVGSKKTNSHGVVLITTDDKDVKVSRRVNATDYRK